jgi:hypothetical protein
MFTRAMVMKSPVFRDITPCSPLKVNRRFGGTRRSAYYLLRAGFLLGLLFVIEDGGECSSETSADFHWTTWRYTPENKLLNNEYQKKHNYSNPSL